MCIKVSGQNEALQPLTPQGIFLWYLFVRNSYRPTLHITAALNVPTKRFLASAVVNEKGRIKHRICESDPSIHSMLAVSLKYISSFQACSCFSS